ncbi:MULTISPECIES: hypothetical protein [unclassified Nonomuraea]|uniref:hypothetical protein n=1 Tax=unclassified Nonomuraea TaxID=2593643 RepID=UPI003409918F
MAVRLAKSFSRSSEVLPGSAVWTANHGLALLGADDSVPATFVAPPTGDLLRAARAAGRSPEHPRPRG